MDQSFEVGTLDPQWTYFCDRFSYKIVYISGGVGIEAPSEALMSQVFLVEGTMVTVEPNLWWVGTFTLRVEALNLGGADQYPQISKEFTLEFVHPCSTSRFNSFELEDMRTTVLRGEPSLQVFSNPADSKSSLYGAMDGYTFCGDRQVSI